MNTLSINIGGGVKQKQKQSWIRNLCNDFKVSVLGMQETKMLQLDLFIVRSFWGNSSFDVATSSARGRSGGLLTIWDPSCFHKNRVLSFNNVLIVDGHLSGSSSPCYILNVYAPQERVAKRQLWSFISDFMSSHPGNYMVFGDFNSVRSANERHGSMFCSLSAADFNHFISSSRLIDYPLGGRAYTRYSKWCDSRAKLDRFLISDGLVDFFPDLNGRVLPNLWSDHCPIILFNDHVDYGPSPFKLFSSWFNMSGFDKVVKDAWVNPALLSMCMGKNPFVVFKDKLKFVKSELKNGRLP
ncbi:uncharacterized protein [Rutidosis leptorrhynchoides]|uniref:uncharacterized protein n=1 Tax=Rutidosis leptorrhynchoides TaxID=125765 RepID=UPI003A99B79B